MKEQNSETKTGGAYIPPAILKAMTSQLKVRNQSITQNLVIYSLRISELKYLSLYMPMIIISVIIIIGD